jgi:hypothetical protein
MAERFANLANRLSKAAFRSGPSGNEPTLGFRLVAGMVGIAIAGLFIYLIRHFGIVVSPYVN